MPETDVPGITTGELSRAVGLIRGDIGKLRDDVNGKPDWQDMRRVEDGLRRELEAETKRLDMKNQLQDVAIVAVEGWQTWALRLGGPALAGALVGVAINGFRIGG